MADVSGRVFNIQRFSTEDGPGIRTTVFLKGCPLKCLWCANPESQSSDFQLGHRDSLCIRCGSCVSACLVNAISLVDAKIEIDRQKCTDCGACVDACAAGAMKVFGHTLKVDEVLEEIKKDMGYYSHSNGGVTISGGEPLMQPDFAAEIFKRCKELGIHTTLDTCGYFSTSALEKVLPFVDLVLFDLKVMNREKHEKYTGVYNDVILKNAATIAANGTQMIIRVPLIPDVNDSEENLTETALFVRKLNSNLHVDLLPYHNYGIKKYEMLGMDYKLTETKRPDKELMQRCQKVFTQHGIDCAIN